MRTGMSPAGPGIVLFSTVATSSLGPAKAGLRAMPMRMAAGCTVSMGGAWGTASMSRTALAWGSRGMVAERRPVCLRVGEDQVPAVETVLAPVGHHVTGLGRIVVGPRGQEVAP